MTLKGKLSKFFMPVFLHIIFFLHLRIIWSLIIRWRLGENNKKRVPVYDFIAPGNIEEAMKKFQYRKDPLDGMLDYVSHPEYIQAVLDDPSISDGDCDDGHWFVANALKKCIGVSDVYYLSSGFSSKDKGIDGGHATCVYKFEGKWFHYDWGIKPIDDPNNAPISIAKRYTGDEQAKATYWVWESVGEVGEDRSGWKLVGINSKLRV